MADPITWPGLKGSYTYWLLTTPGDPQSIKAEAGNYMFVKPTNAGWVPVYIGIADSLRDRIPYHERWTEAVQHGATRAMAHTNGNALAREAEERDLIGYWNPVLNTQHRSGPATRTLLGGFGSRF